MATFTTALKAPTAGATKYYKDDLVELITNISPVDTPLFSMTADTTAGGVSHFWMTDTLAAASVSPSTQGAALAATNYGIPTRQSNTCQINRKDFAVTKTEEAVDKGGTNGSFSYQASKALKILATDSEMVMFQGAESTVDPRQMKGLDAWVTTNTVTSVTTITFTEFTNLQQLCYDATGDLPDYCFVSPVHKRQVSTWFTSITREAGNMDKRQNFSVMEVDTDFGTVKFVTERYYGGTATLHTGYLIKPSRIRKAWLNRTSLERQANDGDYIPGMFFQEWTMEVLDAGTGMGRLLCGTSITLATIE